MNTIQVSAERGYPILIDVDWKTELTSLLKGRTRAALIVSEDMKSRIGEISTGDTKIFTFPIPDGEAGKTSATLLQLWNWLGAAGFTRNDVVIAIGGGATTDFGGYVAGALFGKHPMAPEISPKKSWEGFAGALVLQLIVGIALWVYVFEQPWWEGAIVGFAMMLTATIGDLIESMIKRDLGIKDMGSLLPGHGGVMDRLDSLVINSFVAWLLFGFFL